MATINSVMPPAADEALDALRVRDGLLPLPGHEQGYSSLLLLGTTGAGKTTLVRQLLGTNPRTERFPSTSTAKTTVAETEIVLTQEETYRAAVTFASEDLVAEHLEENCLAAALAILHGKDDIEVLQRLLDHVDQRFRFSYALGQPRALLPSAWDDDDLDDDDELEDAPDLLSTAAEGMQEAARRETAEAVTDAVALLKETVARFVQANQDLAPDAASDDPGVQEALEANLEVVLREEQVTERVVDMLLSQIAQRFDAFQAGDVVYDENEWPLHWTFESDNRRDFLTVLGRFTGNHAKAFGTLLTPLANGIRVTGPFGPTWTTDQPRLVIVDGEGLGHVATSVAALSTFLTSRLDAVDAVLLVDNATVPMQAAPVAAMKAITVSGNARKLHIVFTHFDQVKGDNLPTFSAREQHVRASVENVLNALRDELGATGEMQLRHRVEAGSFFVGGLHTQLNGEKKAGLHSMEQLRGLLAAAQDVAEATTRSSAAPLPVFHKLNLTLAVADATQAFHARWRGLLGLQWHPDYSKEHWARIKALTRRVALGAEEYRHLKPVGELRYELQSRIFVMLQQPVAWIDVEPSASERDDFVTEASNRLTARVFRITAERLVADHHVEWEDAFELSGRGSTMLRAQKVEAEIFEPAAPSSTLRPDGLPNDLVAAVTHAVEEVAAEVGFILR